MAAPVEPGDILAEKYRVEEVLGEGGMGVVVAARHVQLDQKVALKFMLPAALSQPTAADRFLREARAAVRLRSEHVARVIDVGKLENGAPYMVMEFLQGHDLGKELEERGPLPPQEAVGYVLQACAALAEAHDNNVIHRDIKPENLFLTRRPDGRPMVKVLDFGISKIIGSGTDLSATRTGMAMGSPAYMSPEQMKSAKHADARADIWSLGAVLFQLLTGELPYAAETFTEMMAKVLTEEPRSVLDMGTSVDPALSYVVQACLTKDVNTRVQSVPELVDLLAPFAGSEGRLIATSLGRTSSQTAQTAAGRATPTPIPAQYTPVPGQGPGPGSMMVTAPRRTPLPAHGYTPVPGAMAGYTPVPGSNPQSTYTAASGQVAGASSGPGRGWVAGVGVVVVGAIVGVAVMVSTGNRSEPVDEPPAAAAAAGVATPAVGPIDGGAVARDAVPLAATVDASVPVVVDAAPVEMAAPDAATKKKKKKRRKRKHDADDPFGSMF